jgi:hypothetical protein
VGRSEAVSRGEIRKEIDALHGELVDAQFHRIVVRLRNLLATSLTIGLLMAGPMGLATLLGGSFRFVAAAIAFGVSGWFAVQLIPRFLRWQAEADDAKEQVQVLEGRLAAVRAEGTQDRRHEV